MRGLTSHSAAAIADRRRRRPGRRGCAGLKGWGVGEGGSPLGAVLRARARALWSRRAALELSLSPLHRFLRFVPGLVTEYEYKILQLNAIEKIDLKYDYY